MVNPLVGSLILACAGVSLEVTLTGIVNFIKSKDSRLKGYSYIWMLPIYALAYPILSLLLPVIGSWHWIARGLIYTSLFFVVEYLAGWLLHLVLGQCPWEEQYKRKRWAIQNLIRLDYAPGWLLVALIFEYLYKVLN